MYSLSKEIALMVIADYTIIAELIKDKDIEIQYSYLVEVNAQHGICYYIANKIKLNKEEIEGLCVSITSISKRSFICETPYSIYHHAYPYMIEMRDTILSRIQWLKDNLEKFNYSPNKY